MLSGPRLALAEVRHGEYRAAVRDLMYDALAVVPGADQKYETRRHPDRPFADGRRANLVVEGYSGSGNSWAAWTLSLANPGIRLAHHRHRPVQIIEGVRIGLPSLCLVREPVAAIASTIVRDKGMAPEVELYRYAHFYEACKRLCASGRVVVATFDQVTQAIDAVVDRLNVRFGTHFHGLASLGPGGEQKVRDAIAAADNRRLGGDNVDRRGANPSAEREVALAQTREMICRPELAAPLRRCNRLYEAYTRMSMDSE